MTEHRGPRILGIVNVTPDSFSDGGRFLDPGRAVQHGLSLVAEGADGLDVGGESTRPGAEPVSEDAEISRVVPVIAALRRALPSGWLSVDTRHAVVAEAALDAGADTVNDVSGLADPAMLPTVARHGAGLVVMHMRGVPATMQSDTRYDDLVGEVAGFLAERAAAARAAGVRRLWVDPGLGFGKAFDDNSTLIRAVSRLREIAPVLIGASRKRFIGEIIGEPDASARVFGSIGAALAASLAGADVLRVHDVLATRQALSVFERCR